MIRAQILSALCARMKFVRARPIRPLDADRLDIELAELVAVVADLRTVLGENFSFSSTPPDRAKFAEILTRLESSHDRILLALGFGFLMHSVGCACASCKKEIGRVERMPTFPPVAGDHVQRRGTSLESPRSIKETCDHCGAPAGKSCAAWNSGLSLQKRPLPEASK